MERTSDVRVTVVQVEDSFLSHATVIGGEGGGKSTTSEIRLTCEAALTECLTKMARALSRPEEEQHEDGGIFTLRDACAAGPGEPADASGTAGAPGPADASDAPDPTGTGE